MMRTNQPNWICLELKDYKDYKKYGRMGCGTNFAYFYAITFQFFFAIIVINLFVAVILAGHEETSRLDTANLSDFYLETFKDKWSLFDTKARGLIKVKDLIKFLAR